MNELSEVERQVLCAALAGPLSWQQELREQVKHLEVLSREDTGAGVYTRFKLLKTGKLVDIPVEAYREPPQVRATHPAIQGDIFFLVWLKAGAIDQLEMASGHTPIPDQSAIRIIGP